MIVVVLMTLAALAALTLEILESRSRLAPGPRLRRLFAAVLVCTLAAALAVGLARYGSPVKIARDAWHSFNGTAEAGPVRVSTTASFSLPTMAGSSTGG